MIEIKIRMISFRKIFVIARFEVKTLLRSWFFRIFSGLTIVILVFFDIAAITEVGGSGIWLIRGIPSNIPLGNLYMLNIAQAIVAAFLATEFLKRDNKLDTTEVVYMRSMNNSDYIFGKTLGILMVFFLLNFLILLIAGIMNIVNKDITTDFLAYILYPTLISLPTLIFILGLSFILMIIIRNQAVAIVVLLGYIASILFYLGNKFYFLFDYMAFSYPMMKSDFIGFGDNSAMLAQRGIYFSLGCGFIFLTIILFKRLPQSRPMTRLSWVAVVLLFTLSGFLVKQYLEPIHKGKSLRGNMITLNNKYVSDPHVTVTHCDLDLSHNLYHIEAAAKLVFNNETADTIPEYIFTLNPGLNVIEVVCNGNSLPFERDLHLVRIYPDNPLVPQASDSIVLRYEGGIDDHASYLDIDESIRSSELRLDMLTVNRSYSFVTPEYLLLTKELLWYPEAGVNYCTSIPGYHRTSFVNFSLHVSTEDHLLAFSQGAMDSIGGGNFRFVPENPLSQISLVIGKYVQRTVTCDSIEYNLLTLDGHDYFEPYMNELADTLVPVIRELKQDYEREIDLPYLFSRLSLVEVPIHFNSYPRYWTMSQETVQPEMIFLPENGLPIWQADFKERMRRQKENAKRNNQVISDKELQAQLMGQFIRAIITTGNQQTWSYGENIGYGRSAYSVYPNYYNYVYFLKSDKCPIVNMALESFLDKGAAESNDFWSRNWSGLGDEERANLALQEKSYDQILIDKEKSEVAYHVIRLKGFFLFTLLESKIGAADFRESLMLLLEENKFQALDLETLGVALQQEYFLDVESQVDEWFYSDQLPGFLIGSLTSHQFIDDDRTRYQVRFKASNPEQVEGLFMINFRTGGDSQDDYNKGPAQGTDETDSKIVYLEPGQTKEIGVVLDAPPRSMTINSVISQNIPSYIEFTFGEQEVVRRATAFEGERILNSDFSFDNPDEIIVDNEDSNFELAQSSTESYLRKLIKEKSKREEQKYVGIRWWRPPLDWKFITQSGFYGKYIRSAVYTKAGSGENRAFWKTPIENEGFYDVYCHIGDATGVLFGNRNQQNEKYVFKIFHDDGIEVATLELQNSENGWNFLGTYFISSDTAKIEMSNDSDGRMVVADAVKWVRQ